MLPTQRERTSALRQSASGGTGGRGGSCQCVAYGRVEWHLALLIGPAQRSALHCVPGVGARRYEYH